MITHMRKVWRDLTNLDALEWGWPTPQGGDPLHSHNSNVRQTRPQADEAHHRRRGENAA